MNQIATQIFQEEGSRRHVYPDNMGYMTIGIGRLCDKRFPTSGLNDDEQLYLLTNDITSLEGELDKKLPGWRNLSEARRSVIMNMAFQMGVPTLMSFQNTLKAVFEGRYEDAKIGMLNSKWAQQTPERAHRMADQMHLNVWQPKPGFTL